MKLYGFAAGPYQANTYLVANNKHAFVIDPGIHAAERVKSLVLEHELSLEAVVLTHGHLDHTREAGDLAVEFGIPVYIHEADAFMLEPGPWMSEQSRVLFNAEGMVAIPDLRHFSSETLELVGAEFELRHAPGHTPGSTLILSKDAVFTGDVLFRGTVGRTDLYGSDPQAMQDTLRGAVWSLPDSLTILPGHGATSTMRAERATNPFLISLGEVM